MGPGAFRASSRLLAAVHDLKRSLLSELTQTLTARSQLLLLAASANLLLSFASIDAPKHHHTVAVHESDT